jgi:hypothetical protein
MSNTAEWLTPAELAEAFAGTGFPAGATVTYRVYDNLAPVDYTVKWDKGGPSAAGTPDGMVWVETTATLNGRKTRARCLVQQTSVSFVKALPKAALYSDTGVTLSDTSDVYALNADGSADTSGPPFQTSVAAGGTWASGSPAGVGRFTANATSNLAAPGTTTQSLGIAANGSANLAGHTFTDVQTPPVPPIGFLSDYFDQAAQSSLADESQAASNTTLYPHNASGTSVDHAKFTPTNLSTTFLTSINASFNSSTKTYTFNNDIVVTGGDVTLSTSSFPAGTKFNFKSLYATGDLTVSGQLTLNTTALYVANDFTLTGPTSSSAAVKDWLGSVYVPAHSTTTPKTGNVDWSGYVSVTSRNYLNTTAAPQPMWLGRYWERSGTYADEYGPIWVPGNSSTSIALDSTGASTISCPLLCSTEKPTITGNITFGSRTQPMVYFYMCDNNGIYPMTCQFGVPAGRDPWTGVDHPADIPYTGTFYGLMVINESVIDILGGTGTAPSVQGAIFAGCPYVSASTPSMSDITLEGGASVAYDQAVIDAVAYSAIKTTTTVTQIVSGSWQQLPAN